MEKGVFIHDIQPAQAVIGLFCVRTKRLLETRNGDPYLALTLLDRTGEIEARAWDQALEWDSVFSERDYVRIHGEAQRFREAVQLKVNHLEWVDPKEVDPEPFLPVTPADQKALRAEFQRLVKEVQDPILCVLLRAIFGDQDLSKAFRQAPAAKRMHHAYLGGLLEHTVSVARVVRSVCKDYPFLDRNLLLAAALLHDIGKIEEFTYDRPPIEYSDRGRLLGHMVLGVAILDRFAAVAGIERHEGRLVALKHLVLSHHGEREFGSPVVPMTEEAFALHLLDDLDAKLNYLNTLREEVPGPGYGWTGYQRLMDRFFYLRSRAGATEALEGERPSEDRGPGLAARQPTLWPHEDG